MNPNHEYEEKRDPMEDTAVRPAIGQPMPARPAHVPNPDAAWSPYGAARQYSRSGAQQQETPPKKSGRFVKGVAVLAACAVFGFGGGYLANTVWPAKDGTTVIYKAPEDSGFTRTSSGEEMSVSEAAAKAGQSVVSVRTENVVSDRYGSQTAEGAGSGVILTEDGYIITNNHVVEGATDIWVTLPNGEEHLATVVGTDARSDIAVLKVNVSGLVPAVIGDGGNLLVGDFCLAIGNPMGSLGGTVTDGIISGLDRDVSIEGTPMSLIQMSAAVSPGNSGGGLFNSRGELVGIVNAKANSENTEGLGFAIPVDTAVQVAQELIENGYVKGRPALGITAQQMQVQGEDGRTVVTVAAVTEGGAAEKAGIQEGDILLGVNGQAISTLAELTTVLDGCKVGDKVRVDVQRGEQRLQLDVTLQELTPVNSTVGT